MLVCGFELLPLCDAGATQTKTSIWDKAVVLAQEGHSYACRRDPLRTLDTLAIGNETQHQLKPSLTIAAARKVA